jgi:hypothetical protein
MVRAPIPILNKLDFSGARPEGYSPQVLPVLQLVERPELKLKELLPVTMAAKVDIFLLTSGLAQSGQMTATTASELRSNSSKGSPQVLQINSKIGIDRPLKIPAIGKN